VVILVAFSHKTGSLLTAKLDTSQMQSFYGRFWIQNDLKRYLPAEIAPPVVYDPTSTGSCSRDVNMFVLDKQQLAQPAPSGLFLVGPMDANKEGLNPHYMGIGRFQVK
jgi:hypothetical protein